MTEKEKLIRQGVINHGDEFLERYVYNWVDQQIGLESASYYIRGCKDVEIMATKEPRESLNKSIKEKPNSDLKKRMRDEWRLTGDDFVKDISKYGYKFENILISHYSVRLQLMSEDNTNKNQVVLNYQDEVVDWL